MSKSWMCAILGAAAFSAVSLAQDVRAEDLVERDREGEVKIRDDSAGFGAAGQWTFSTDTALSIERRTLRAMTKAKANPPKNTTRRIGSSKAAINSLSTTHDLLRRGPVHGRRTIDRKPPDRAAANHVL